MGVYDDILDSLQELQAHAEGKPTGVKIHSVTVASLEEYSAQDIKEIRLATGMTQKLFAACMGVSVKCIEAWEGGRSHPDGAARRLLGMMRKNPEFAKDNGILSA